MSSDVFRPGGRFQRQCEQARTVFGTESFNEALLVKGGICSGSMQFNEFLEFLIKHPEEAVVDPDRVSARFLSASEKRARAEAVAKSLPQKVRQLRPQNHR